MMAEHLQAREQHRVPSLWERASLGLDNHFVSESRKAATRLG